MELEEKLVELSAVIEQLKIEKDELTSKSTIQSSNYAILASELSQLNQQQEKDNLTSKTDPEHIIGDTIPLLQKTLFKNIEPFQDQFNLGETKQFIAKFDDFFDCTYPNGINELQAIAFFRTKLNADTREEFIRVVPRLNTWHSTRQWLLNRRALSLDSEKENFEKLSKMENHSEATSLHVKRSLWV
jgi:hypothetical protein